MQFQKRFCPIVIFSCLPDHLRKCIHGHHLLLLSQFTPSSFFFLSCFRIREQQQKSANRSTHMNSVSILWGNYKSNICMKSSTDIVGFIYKTYRETLYCIDFPTIPINFIRICGDFPVTCKVITCNAYLFFDTISTCVHQ